MDSLPAHARSEGIVSDLPVAVLGGGPVGLAAAAHLLARGQTPLVFEAGAQVGASLREWGHVRLFSPWRHLVDPTSKSLLERHGWRQSDPDTHPTGHELVAALLEPLAGLPAMVPTLRLGHSVTAVTRMGFDRLQTSGRDAAPFQIVAQGPGGEVRSLARAVIDATGTWQSPNTLGSGGVAAQGELASAERVRYGIPDVLGAERQRYAGQRTMVVGSGHSAFNAVIDLAALAVTSPGTEVVWAVRRGDLGKVFGGGAADALSARGALGTRVRSLVADRGVELLTGFRIVTLESTVGRLTVVAADGRPQVVDQVIAATGYRPDPRLTRELRLDLDPVTEAPVRLAPLIDPNVHSCGSVPAHGETELAHAEPGYYVVGMKSYGRAPTFLLLTGYEQVRSVAAFLAGDLEAARRVELDLPETGVCSATLPGSDVGCCGGPDASQQPQQSGLELAVVHAPTCCG